MNIDTIINAKLKSLIYFYKKLQPKTNASDSKTSHTKTQTQTHHYEVDIWNTVLSQELFSKLLVYKYRTKCSKYCKLQSSKSPGGQSRDIPYVNSVTSWDVQFLQKGKLRTSVKVRKYITNILILVLKPN